MADNLFFSRDTRVIVSDAASGGSSYWEIPVLDGFSFSQATNTSEITLNEMAAASGSASRRGRRMFNDSYAPAEWSFSTYARPFVAAPAAVATNAVWENTGCDAQMHAVEEVLWAALVSNTAFTKSSGTNESIWSGAGVTNTTSALTFNFSASNVVALKTLDIYFVMGQGAYNASTHTVYKLEGAVVNSAGMDFDIDGITTINWSGFASMITEVAALPTVTISEATTATNNFIRNRLTTLAVTNTAFSTDTDGDGTIESGETSATTYTLTLTGGSLNFENNITFLTPETLGVVNKPLGHVTGTRNISGNFTCYLSNSTGASADLFEDLVEATTTITNDFNLVFSIGGASNPKIAVTLPTCHLEIPTHSVEDIISMETNFHALPSTIGGADDASIVYTGVAV
jgi:hypothetical protein